MAINYSTTEKNQYAYKLEGFDLVGLVDKNPTIRENLSDELGGIDQFDDFDTALVATRPEAVAISLEVNGAFRQDKTFASCSLIFPSFFRSA